MDHSAHHQNSHGHESEEHKQLEEQEHVLQAGHANIDHAPQAGHVAMGHAPATEHAAHIPEERQAHPARHIDHSGHEATFRKRFWVSLALSIPVLLYSPMVQQLLGFSMPAFPGSQWIEPLFSVIVFLYGGMPFLQMAVPELRNRQPGMMTLISLAISVAFLYSLAALRHGRVPAAMGFFWELVTLIDIMLLGHWLEMRSVRQASGALDELAKLMPDTAERIRPDGGVEIVAVSVLRSGDLVLVRPGASIPADGEVARRRIGCERSHDHRRIEAGQQGTGRSKVIAGTINGDGSLRVQVTATGRILPWPASCAWWMKRSAASPAPRCWPTRLPGGCSTLLWAWPP